MTKHKNKVLKISMATLALLMSAGYVMQDVQVTPTYAQVSKMTDTSNLISSSTTWKYLDNNIDPGTSEDRYAWTKADYQDDTWKIASGKFGAKNGQLSDIGNGLIPTVLLNQYINGANIPAFFFKTTVNISNINELTSITGKLFYDDAAIVYINGMKVAAFDEPDGGFESNMTYGGSNASTPKEGALLLTKDQLQNVLVTGENIVAVEIHQGRASSSDVYFEFNDLKANYNELETEIEQKALTLTVGEDESQMNLTWYANSSIQGVVQLAKADTMVNGQFPDNYEIINAINDLSNDNGFYYNQATISNLKENTKYVYRIVNGDKVSKTYNFTTKDFDESYNFILAGDPQIGASGNASNDTEGWNKTLNDAINKFSPNFILSAGDQVNTASNESQYRGYLEHDELTSVPQATTIGNHDSSSNAYSQHFNLPNETDKGTTTAGGDYWYVYNNTLFMNINTNNTSTAEHKAFMEEAIQANPDVKWKVVVFHHSVYSVASHAVENAILQRREELTPVFDTLGIDVVLMGHDHVYVRSNIMKGMQVSQDTTNLSTVTNPDGILYITANSASGSKYYNIKTDISTEFVAKMDQSKQRSISNIEVSDNNFKVTTYLYDANSNDWETLDTFTINKTTKIDKTFLQIAIEEANKVTFEQIDSLVPIVADEFKIALAKAKEIYDNTNATQEQVNEASSKLVLMMHYLDFKKGDKAALQALVDTINNLDATKYSKVSWEAMIPVLEASRVILADENALQVDVIASQDSLIKAYLNLRLIPNKDILNDLIKQAETLKQTNYSSADWNLLQSTLAYARSILSSEEVTEAKISEAQTALSSVLAVIKPISNTVIPQNTAPATSDNTNIIVNSILLFTMLGCLLIIYKTRKNKSVN